jgi:hypothetical protein
VLPGLLLAVALAFAAVPAAGATTFGADLSRPANATFTCGQVPPFGIWIGAQSCTWGTVTSQLGTAKETFVVPAGNGTLTQVRVRVGPVTGPMKVVVLRALRQPNAPPDGGAACCKLVAETQVFTPAANAITTLPVSIPVRHDLTPDPASGLYNFDQLALSVLAPGVPVPAHDTGIYNGTGPVDNVYWPAWQQVGQERADGAGLEGYVVLLNADWGASPAGAPAPPPPPAPPVATPLRLARPTAGIRGRDALLRLRCAPGTPCAGWVRLQNRAGVGPAAAAARLVSYGAARFTVQAGTARTVRVRLNARGWRFLGRRRSARVWARLSLNGSPTIIPAARLVLKR